MFSNFPNGFSGGVSIRGLPVGNFYATSAGPANVTSSGVYWVDSTYGANGNDGTMYTPWSTLAYAVTRLKANDIVMVRPGHTETISSATALALSVAGVTIVGLGVGAQRPTFTLDTAATTTIPVSAASVTVANCIFSANYADIAAVFTLTTAKNFTLLGNKFKATATNMNFLYIVDTSTTDNAADGLTAIGNVWIEVDTADVSFVKGDADIDSFVFQKNYISLGVNNSGPAVATMATGKDLTNVMVGGSSPSDGNQIFRLNTANPLLITADTTTANTGIVANNFVKHADTAAELLVTAATSFGFFNNYATAVDDKSGFILPAVDS